MYFPHAYKKAFFIGPNGLSTLDLTVANAAASTNALLAGQLGIVRVAANQNLVYNNGATIATNVAPYSTGSGYTAQPYYLAMGSWYKSSGYSDKIGAHGGYQESIKSKIINPRYVNRVIAIKSKTPLNQVVRVNASAFVAVNQTYRLRLDVKGSPALRFLNHQLYRTLDAYTGVVGATAANVWRDPSVVMLGWKEQINGSPLLNQIVQARTYVYKASITASGAGTGGSTTQITIPTASTTGAYVGMRITGAGLPANSFITAVSSNVSVTVKFPPHTAVVATTATVYKMYLDTYSATENGVATAGTATYIPGTTILTNGTVGTAQTIAAATSGALILTTEADNSAQTGNFSAAIGECFMELTGGYVDTVFGNATFTPTDKYELEPVIIYASVVDELNNTNLSTTFVANTSATSPYLSSHGVELQAPSQATGYGETVLRDLILEGRYRQEAFPDSSRVDSFRMREIEQNPMFNSSVTGSVSRSSYYDQILILHSVPRFNNPTGMFDTDQYLIQIYLPAGSIAAAGTGLTNFTNWVVGTANAAQGGTAVTLETF